jgi:hypothetical protein
MEWFADSLLSGVEPASRRSIERCQSAQCLFSRRGFAIVFYEEDRIPPGVIHEVEVIAYDDAIRDIIWLL